MKLTIIFLLLSTLAFGQTVEYYERGYEGIVGTGKIVDSTLIFSNHKAKGTIRIEVCDTIVRRYLNKKMSTKKLVLNISKAKVTGTLVVTRKNKLIALDFYYEMVEWKDSIIEKPKEKPKPIIKNKKKVTR
jgi:hypothetical protein